MKTLLVRFAPQPLSDGFVSALERIRNAEKPDCIIFSGGISTEELAVRLSVRTGIPCCTGAIRLSVTETGVTATRHIYGGELIADYHLPTPCFIVADRNIDLDDICPDEISPNEISPDEISICGKLLDIKQDHASESWFEGFEAKQDIAAGELKSAEKIIVAGRGIKNKAQLKTIAELADRLGAAVGATRPVVYNGLAPLSSQIGVSGTSVSPDVCLVIGASGSQAFLGAVDKKTRIIAVNSDPAAPIFHRADWGVIGDGNEILRELTEVMSSADDKGGVL